MSKEETHAHPLSKIWEIILKQLKSKSFWIILGLFFLILFVVRFSLIKDDQTHYHANFAVYINGRQEKFESPLYYQEVQSCSSDDLDDPMHRVHMHGNENSVIHVHANAVTWGHFFTNIGYGLTKNLIETPEGLLVDGKDGKKLTFYLNGEEVDSVTNKLIGNEDKLLVDYGTVDKERLNKESSEIKNLAHEANIKQDPASCSGGELNTKDKLISALKFWQ